MIHIEEESEREWDTKLNKLTQSNNIKSLVKKKVYIILVFKCNASTKWLLMLSLLPICVFFLHISSHNLITFSALFSLGAQMQTSAHTRSALHITYFFIVYSCVWVCVCVSLQVKWETEKEKQQQQQKISNVWNWCINHSFSN